MAAIHFETFAFALVLQQIEYHLAVVTRPDEIPVQRGAFRHVAHEILENRRRLHEIVQSELARRDFKPFHSLSVLAQDAFSQTVILGAFPKYRMRNLDGFVALHRGSVAYIVARVPVDEKRVGHVVVVLSPEFQEPRAGPVQTVFQIVFGYVAPEDEGEPGGDPFGEISAFSAGQIDQGVAPARRPDNEATFDKEIVEIAQPLRVVSHLRGAVVIDVVVFACRLRYVLTRNHPPGDRLMDRFPI